MLNTIDAISQLLQGSFLEGQFVRQLEIPDSNQWAFLLVVDQVNALNAWYLMRSLLRETGRYPVLSEGWGSDDFFSRFYYQEEVASGKLSNSSPEAFIANTSMADLEAFLAARKVSRGEYLENAISFSLASARDRFGSCPQRSQMYNHSSWNLPAGSCTVALGR